MLLLVVASTLTTDRTNNMVANALSDTMPRQRQTPTKNWLVVDFDGTCTVKDTVKMLPRLASIAQSKKLRQDFGSTSSDEVFSADAVMDFQGRISVFSMLEDAYFKMYTEAQKLIRQQQHTSYLDQNSLLEQLEESLVKLDTVSTEITHEVSKWSVLKGLGGISPEEMLEILDLYKKNQNNLEPTRAENKVTAGGSNEELLECLSLQKGCISVLKDRLVSNEYNVGVLSINWCPALIQSLLVHPLCGTIAFVPDDNDDGSKPEAASLGFGEVPVWSNSVTKDGTVKLPFEGAIAKKEHILRLQQQRREGDDIMDPGAVVVYVGDSSTDLLAILQADVGILLGGSSSAIELAKGFGVLVKPLADFAPGDLPVVWTADNWDEIGSFLSQT